MPKFKFLNLDFNFQLPTSGNDRISAAIDESTRPMATAAEVGSSTCRAQAGFGLPQIPDAEIQIPEFRF